MADNSQVLPNNFGFPLAWIYTNKNEPINVIGDHKETLNINSLITYFKYRYDEENDDECIIRLGLTNVEQLNNSYFKEDILLKVQWGYILPNGVLVKSAIRTIAVRNVNPDYKSDGLTLELICSDLVSYLRTIKENKTSSTDILDDYINEILNDGFVATRTIKGKTKLITQIGANINTRGNAILNNARNNTVIGGVSPQEYQETLLRESDIDHDHYDIAAVELNGSAIIVKENDLRIQGKSKVIRSLIEEKLNQAKDGPYHIDGRDNVLNIIKRDFTQSPYKQYTYQGGTGELIEFKADSNEITTRDDEAEMSYVNPVTKKVEVTKMAHAVEHEGQFANEGLPEGLTEIDVKLWADAYITLLNKNLSLENLEDQFEAEKEYQTFKKTRMSPRGTYNNSNNMGTTRVAKGPEVFEKIISVKTKVLLTSPYFNRVRRENLLENYILKKIEKKYEARTKVIGDPSLISSRIYNFLGLSNTDKGKWYAIAVDHEITPNQGYICSMELVRKPKLIARVKQKKEDDPNSNSAGTSEFDKKEVRYVTENTNNNPLFIGLQYDDINNRLQQQQISESYYQNDSDIYFNTKTPNINNKPPINSQDA